MKNTKSDIKRKDFPEFRHMEGQGDIIPSEIPRTSLFRGVNNSEKIPYTFRKKSQKIPKNPEKSLKILKKIPKNL